MKEFPSKEHWQNCYGTLLDSFLKIDAIIGDIIILWVCRSHFTSSERESALLGPLLKKKQELGGTRFIHKACILYKRLLGTSGVLRVHSKLRRSKFSQLAESCTQYQQVLVV